MVYVLYLYFTCFSEQTVVSEAASTGWPCSRGIILYYIREILTANLNVTSIDVLLHIVTAVNGNNDRLLW